MHSGFRVYLEIGVGDEAGAQALAQHLVEVHLQGTHLDIGHQPKEESGECLKERSPPSRCDCLFLLFSCVPRQAVVRGECLFTCTACLHVLPVHLSDPAAVRVESSRGLQRRLNERLGLSDTGGSRTGRETVSRYHVSHGARAVWAADKGFGEALRPLLGAGLELAVPGTRSVLPGPPTGTRLQLAPGCDVLQRPAAHLP